MVAFDNLMDQMPGNRVFRGSSFDAKSTFRVPRHSCARTFSGAPLAPPQMRWISPHALRAAPCDAAVVGAAPQRLRICALPCSVDADVPGAPAPFLDWGVRRTRPANTSIVHAGNGTRAAQHCKICAPECRARPRTVSEQRELLPRPSLDATRPCEGSVPVGCICKVGREISPGRAMLIVLGRGAIPRSDDTRHERRPAARALPSSSSRMAPRSRVWMTHGTIPCADDTQRRRRRSRSPCAPAPILELAHGTPIPRSRVRTTHGGMGVGPAARALPPLELVHGTPIPRLDTRCDLAFGRHTAARASVLQPARSHPRARAGQPDPVVWTTHGGTGVGSAASTLPPSSSRTAPQSRVWTPYGGASVGLAARALLPNLHHLLELTHGTPTPRSDDTRTRRRGRRSRFRSPRSHLTCTIPAGNCSHYVWTSARSRHTLAARAQAQYSASE
ncbi:hypothetical protein B0H14DRAFT_1662452 [Mycena olivaceomarginata]|nr:hypothetical protein B0H14DRAFT_1662452 [Mycena olivaceomarginata]